MEGSEGQPSPRVLTGHYALVSYIPGYLGAFLDKLRAELVPRCEAKAHVSVLPPRSLEAPEDQLVQELRRRTRRLQSFELTLGRVEMFSGTNVVYLSLEAGEPRIRELHAELRTGILDFAEPFQFHPHVTLAQEIPNGMATEVMELARKRWRECICHRAFSVDHLVFVRNHSPANWHTISEFKLGPITLPRIA